MDLHEKIMNIPAAVPSGYNRAESLAYRLGHREARQAAAKLACTDRQADDARRYALVRTLTPQAFAELYATNMETGRPLDELLDDLAAILSPNTSLTARRNAASS